MQTIVTSLAAATHQPPTAPLAVHAAEVALLQKFLADEDSSLAGHAHVIYAALGVTSGADFKELTEADILSDQRIPMLHRKRLLVVAKRNGLDTLPS